MGFGSRPQRVSGHGPLVLATVQKWGGGGGVVEMLLLDPALKCLHPSETYLQIVTLEDPWACFPLKNYTETHSELTLHLAFTALSWDGVHSQDTNLSFYWSP